MRAGTGRSGARTDATCVLALNLIGEALHDALNPQLRDR
jgi:hypothetical protein